MQAKPRSVLAVGLLLGLTCVLLVPYLLSTTWSLVDEWTWTSYCMAWHSAILKGSLFEFLTVNDGGDRLSPSSYLFDWGRWLACDGSAFAWHASNLPIFFIPGFLLFWMVRRLTGSTDAGFVAGVVFLGYSGGVDNLYQWVPLESRVFLFLSLLLAAIVALAYRLEEGRSSRAWTATACLAAVAVAWSKENAGVVSAALVFGAFLALRLRPVPESAANRRFALALGAVGLSAFLAAALLHGTRMALMHATGAASRPTYVRTFVDLPSIPVTLAKYMVVLWNCGGPLLLIPLVAAAWAAWRVFRRPSVPWRAGFWLLFFAGIFACFLAALLPWHMASGKYLHPAIWALAAATGILWAAAARRVPLRRLLLACFAMYLVVNGFRLCHAARWVVVRDETVGEVFLFLKTEWAGQPQRGRLFTATRDGIRPDRAYETCLSAFHGVPWSQDPALDSRASPGPRDWIIHPVSYHTGHMTASSFPDELNPVGDPARRFGSTRPVFQTASAWPSVTIYPDAPLFNAIKALPLPRIHDTMERRERRRVIDRGVFRREWRIYRVGDLPKDWTPASSCRGPDGDPSPSRK